MTAPRVLFAGKDDWANVSNRIARAMNATAGERVAWVYTQNRHPFGYEEEIVSDPANVARSVEWVIWTGDGDYDWFTRFLKRLEWTGKIATQHVGTAYRTRSKLFNELDAQIGARVRFVSADLFRLAGNGPPAFPRFAPFEAAASITPWTSGALRVVHAPTNRRAKNTDAILEAVNGLPIEFSLLEGLSFQECLKRRGEAHVVIDQLNPEIGAFGQTATESMAQGLMVMTSIPQCRQAWEILPCPPVWVCKGGGGHDLRADLEFLARRPDIVNHARREGLDFARRHFAPAAVARWYWEHLT